MKNPLTPAGIEPTTFRFVIQHRNHCATAVELIYNCLYILCHVSKCNMSTDSNLFGLLLVEKLIQIYFTRQFERAVSL